MIVIRSACESTGFNGYLNNSMFNDDVPTLQQILEYLMINKVAADYVKISTNSNLTNFNKSLPRIDACIVEIIPNKYAINGTTFGWTRSIIRATYIGDAKMYVNTATNSDNSITLSGWKELTSS